MKKEIRVLHLPTNTGNNPWALSRAERNLGIKSDVLIFEDHKFYNNYDLNLHLDYFSIPGEIKKWKYFKKLINNYDIFHFNWGQSFLDYPYIGLDYLDFKILKKAGKKIIITFQGSDARKKDYFIEHFGPGPFKSQGYSLMDKLSDWRKEKRFQKIKKFADKIYALNPDLLNVLPKRAEFLPYAVEMRNSQAKRSHGSSPITIVHAPSHRFTKGTDYIFPVIGKLKEKYPINFILIENMENKSAQSIYDHADIAIDQLLVGWYGAFGVEMMARGVPVLANIRHKDVEKFVPFYKEIPIVNTNIDNLEENLELLIKEKNLRKKIGILGQKYARAYHDPKKVALYLKRVYNCLLS